MKEYIDTSIIVKWYREKEAMHEKSLDLRAEIMRSKDRFFMSKYGILELVRALQKNGFPDHVIYRSCDQISTLFQLGIINGHSIDDALDLTYRIEIDLSLYASDALHLASAILSGCSVFWSCDNHHLKKKTAAYLLDYGITVKCLSSYDMNKEGY